MSLYSSRAVHFLKLNPALSYSVSNLSRSFLSLFSTVSSPIASSAEPISIVDYLRTNFKFSKASSIYISKRLSQDRCPEHRWSVLNYFKQIGFSKSQIQSLISQQPQILFSSIDKTLKPKIDYIQHLGFKDSELCNLLSKNPNFLTRSLNKTLIPSVLTIRKIVSDEKDLIKLLDRSGNWLIPSYRRVLRNAAFLQSCGIIGSQLSSLLKRHSRLFVTRESLLRSYVSRAVNMGFCIKSRNFVHAFRAVSSLTMVKFNRKLKLIQSCGFSEEETMHMFRKMPMLLNTSEKKLKFGIHVCLDKILLPKSLLVNNPVILMLSIEERVIPRWRVLQLLISKELLKKNPSFRYVFVLQEKKFLENYILKFRDNEEALLKVYKGPYLEDASPS